MSDLIEFLKARLDEDERVAQLAADDFGATRWKMPEQRSDTPFSTIHLQRHPPARVLREVEAKRKIIGWVEGAQAAAGDPPGFDPQDAEALSHAVRLLALPYADHPDYDPEWATSA